MSDKIISTITSIYLIGFTLAFWLIESITLWGVWNQMMARYFHVSPWSLGQAACVNSLLWLAKEFMGGMSLRHYIILQRADQEREFIAGLKVKMAEGGELE